MESWNKVFVAVLFLSILQTALLLSEPLWFRFILSAFQLSPNPQNLALLTSSITLVSLLIEPGATFFVMYLLGRGAVLASFPTSYFVRLLGGALLGTFSTVAVLTLYYYSTGLGSIFGLAYLATLSSYAFGAFRMALVGFAGLALAYFARPPTPGTSPTMA